jgi:hypothetical protein
MEYKEIVVEMPKHDCDVSIRFPGGPILTVQARPSNADTNYNGSLDIILPQNQLVTSWIGEDMEEAPAPDYKRQHERTTMQLVTDLPGDYQ